MYSIVNWDNDEIITTAAKLSTAKRLCRQQGHVGDDRAGHYAPIARVQDENGFCVYNPVFKVGKDDHLKAEKFVVAQSDDGEFWTVVDTRGSLRFANILASNVEAPMVAVFTAAQWRDGSLRPRSLRDNRDKNKLPVCGLEGLINSAPSDHF
jgi:hypothetical protein